MTIGKFRHKGLRRLYEDDDPSGLSAHCVRKIKAILAALEFADNLSQVATLPGWKLHPLRGIRKGECSITVTANWRITFRVDGNVVTEVNPVPRTYVPGFGALPFGEFHNILPRTHVRRLLWYGVNFEDYH